MMLVIIHDNGVKGKRGYSDEIVNDKAQVDDVLKKYSDAGCTVYEHYLCEE